MYRIDKMNCKPSGQCFLEYSCAPLLSCLLGNEELLRKGMCTEFRFDSYGGTTVVAPTHIDIVFGSTGCNAKKEALLVTDVPDRRSPADKICGAG